MDNKEDSDKAGGEEEKYEPDFTAVESKASILSKIQELENSSTSAVDTSLDTGRIDTLVP